MSVRTGAMYSQRQHTPSGLIVARLEYVAVYLLTFHSYHTYYANMDVMTDRIRQAIRIAMLRQQVSQTELADRVGLSRQHVNHLLTGHRGRLPDGWEKLLGGLGLELVVREISRRDSGNQNSIEF